MPQPTKIRRALISVYDKTGVVDFAKALHEEFGIELISTGGTAQTLKDAGLPVTLVEDVTGFPEMMDGRVKTLHPKIHAAILADRDNPEHMRQLKEQGIEPIDMVVVNLYPFEKTIARPDCTFEEAIEMIDIGGPCLLRAAAKNHRHVLVLSSPEEYGESLEHLRASGGSSAYLERLVSAVQVFQDTSHYDLQVYRNFSTFLAWALQRRATKEGEEAATEQVPAQAIVSLDRDRILRYGENLHQDGALWRIVLASGLTHRATLADRQALRELAPAATVELSFNNYADASAALELCAELTRAGRAKILFAVPRRDVPVVRREEIPADAEKNIPSAPKETHQSVAAPLKASRRFEPVRDEVSTRRKLPHWQIGGATYFISFASAIGTLSESEREVVFNAVRFWDRKKLDLHAAVVMPEHVHALLTPREVPGRPGEAFNLSELLQSIKAHSGREISKQRGGVGQVWARESFDRWIRSESDFVEKWMYIAENPVKEGLAKTATEYRWWYGIDPTGTLDPAETTGEERAPSVEGGKEDLCSPRVALFIKHTNACGAAVDADPPEAYRKAYLGDPNAAMGGILAVNFPVDAGFAEAVMETYQRWGKKAGAGGFFVEVWLAPAFDQEAVRLIRAKKKWGKRVRLLDVGELSAPPDPNEIDFKRIAGGVLMQNKDLVGLNEDQWKVVTERQPTETEISDLRLAWLICKHTKSNAITICSGGMLIGNGAGQMSRVMSCRIATWLAKENGHEEKLKEAVAASDAFFPFRDGPDILTGAGVTALIQPGGSKRDQEVIDACNERRVAMIFTGTRHFKH